jgi:hypothetical protein
MSGSSDGFSFALPLEPEKLLFIVEKGLVHLASCHLHFLDRFKHDTITLFQYQVRWLSPSEGVLLPSSKRMLCIRARRPQAKKRAKVDAAPDGLHEHGALDVDLQEGAPELLEEMLADAMEQDDEEEGAEPAVPHACRHDDMY